MHKQAGTLSTELVQTAHSSAIRAVSFPHDYSEVFATASKGEIRVWHRNRRELLLRIGVPGIECTCLAITQVGVEKIEFERSRIPKDRIRKENRG